MRESLLQTFYGPPTGGVFSPSVQYTLFQMAKAVIDRCALSGYTFNFRLHSHVSNIVTVYAGCRICRVAEVESVYLNMPNLHFLPCAPVTSRFDDDVYVATSEPHGNIEAVVTRAQASPHAKL